MLSEGFGVSLLPGGLCPVFRHAVCPCGGAVRRSGPYCCPNAACGWTGICLVCHKDSPRAVRARHRWVITPCLGNASDSVLLSPFVVTGRIMARRARQQRLLKGSAGEAGHRLTARNGDTFLYTDTLRYAPWMESGLNLRLDIDREGCCRVQTVGSVVSSGAFPVALPYRPSVCEVAPQVSRSVAEHAADYPFLCEAGSRPLRESGIGIRFRAASAVVDTLYSANAGNLRRITEAIGLLRADSCAFLQGISITGYASPEGATELNRKLSAKRAEALRHALSVRMNLPVSLFELNAGGVDWGRLAELVNESDMTYKEEVLAILRSHPEEERNDRLKLWREGVRIVRCWMCSIRSCAMPATSVWSMPTVLTVWRIR